MLNNEIYCSILENPEDENLRLILADWLEEQGDILAEFIRIQIALSKKSDKLLKKRERFIYNNYMFDWVNKFFKENCIDIPQKKGQ